MIITPPTAEAAPERWVQIEGPWGPFEVKLRPPTFDEWLADATSPVPTLAKRFGHVVDWRGLDGRVVVTGDPAAGITPDNPVETSEPIPFDVGTLRRICGTYTGVAAQIAVHVNRLYRSMGETESGN